MKNLMAMLPISLFVLLSCKTNNTNKEYINKLNDPILYSKTVKKLNDVVLMNNFPPMIASRNYVYANIAAYECIAAGDTSFKSMTNQIKHFKNLSTPKLNHKINYQLAALLSFTKVGNNVTFPEGSLMDYYSELKKMATNWGMPKKELESTTSFSDSIVASVMRWSKNDNYLQTRSAEKYTVLTETPSRWIPTPPMYANAVEPHWSEIRLMVLDSATLFTAPPPPTFDIQNKNSAYFNAVMQVKKAGNNLTEEQKEIALFWDDNPLKMNVVGHANYATKKFSPPGHWMNIVGIASKEKNINFNTTVGAYTLSAITLFDAFICCWAQKFKSNSVRPETVINRSIDDNWRPFIQTPPFPSYVSGHATISAATSQVLTNWFGDNLIIKDTSQLEFGLKVRTFNSFKTAANEAAISRLYGGIHFAYDNIEGSKLGEKIGNYILQKLKFKK